MGVITSCILTAHIQLFYTINWLKEYIRKLLPYKVGSIRPQCYFNWQNVMASHFFPIFFSCSLYFISHLIICNIKLLNIHMNACSLVFVFTGHGLDCISANSIFFFAQRSKHERCSNSLSPVCARWGDIPLIGFYNKRNSSHYVIPKHWTLKTKLVTCKQFSCYLRVILLSVCEWPTSKLYR